MDEKYCGWVSINNYNCGEMMRSKMKVKWQSTKNYSFYWLCSKLPPLRTISEEKRNNHTCNVYNTMMLYRQWGKNTGEYISCYLADSISALMCSTVIYKWVSEGILQHMNLVVIKWNLPDLNAYQCHVRHQHISEGALDKGIFMNTAETPLFK